MPFFVYFLLCSDGSYYCGYTKDLNKRLKKHNEGSASKYTRARLPVKLIYSEPQSTQLLAMRRELELKKLSRKKKEELILSTIK
ncbi:GIY-YIG catalytic domain protein [uncultured archaeon]|nr:GIY-YIG catalytic domain protein [uncultured archaeon]